MSRTRRPAGTGSAERGVTAVTYALMVTVVALLVSVGFMLLHGGVTANLRQGGCVVSFDSGQGCPSGGGGTGGGAGTPPGDTTTSSSTTSTTGPS